MSKMNPPDFKMTLGGVDFSDPEMAKRVIEIEVENIADGPDYFKVMLDDRDEYFALPLSSQVQVPRCCADCFAGFGSAKGGDAQHLHIEPDQGVDQSHKITPLPPTR